MILLSLITAALGLFAFVLLVLILWPPPREERHDRDERRARRRLYPPGDTVDRVDT